MPKKKEVQVEIEPVPDGERAPEVEKVKRPPKDVEEALKQYLPGLVEAAQQVSITFQTPVPFLGQLVVSVPSLRTEAADNGVWAATIASEILRRLEPMVTRARELEEERREKEREELKKATEEWRKANPQSVGYVGPVPPPVTRCDQQPD